MAQPAQDIIINQNIDSLIEKLAPAHIIYLNDSMLLIKLHKNVHFTDWLTRKKILPTVKIFHSEANKIYNNQRLVDSSPATPLFVTMCMIPNESRKKVSLICCGTDIRQLRKTIFGDLKLSSGVIFNGSFFFLPVHIQNKMYGLQNPELVYKPIGPYKNSADRTGKDLPNIVDQSNVFPLDPAMISFNNVRHSLQWVEETLAILIIDENGTMSIVDIMTFRKQQKGYSQKSQFLMGNSLVLNGDIIMREELMSIVYTLKETQGLPAFTRCWLSNKDGTIMGPAEISRLQLSQEIFIRDVSGGMIHSTGYWTSEIFFPYTVSLYEREFGQAFAGKIPPAMPTHASDLNPRTCLFIDNNNNIFVMHVEGRQRNIGGIGIDLFDLAKMCKEMGAVNAINLDGGGSSKILWKELGVTADYVGQREYTIGNAIAIVPK